ncbi:MAG: LamG-like jellyroll fold domain-containing protein, partial [Planctomycetota bacterium]
MCRKLFYLMALILVSGIISNSASAGLADNYPGDVGIENDPNVVFVENFEEGSIPAVIARWDSYKRSDRMSLEADIPPPSSGLASLLMTHEGGDGDAIDLYTRLLPGFDELYFRFYVKIDTACNPIHHFVHMGGYNPPSPWPLGGAGQRPDGDDRFSTAIEPHGTAWRWDYYTYWMEMHGNSNPGTYWGNDFINDSNFNVVRGEWLCVEVMVKMNYPTTERNGEQAVWVNGLPWYMGGQLVSYLGEGFPNGYWIWDSWYPDLGSGPFEGFRWRSVEDLNLNFFWLETYITTAPTGYISKVWFDDIVIAKEYIGPINTTTQPPGQATNPSPANSATDVSVDADLSWTPGTGATSSDVYFGTDSTPDSGEFQGNQTAATFDPGTLSYDVTYYWRIDEVNAVGTTTGSVWSFTTEATPPPLPGQAGNPSPADSATDVAVSADLSWTAGSDATSHDVYFGTTSPGTFQGNQTAVTFDPGTMANDTTYYWRIDEINSTGTTTGVVWSFTTIVATGPEPIGWWQLDEGSGATVDDSSSYGNDGTIDGPAWLNDAERGWCLNFDGDANDKVVIPNEPFFDLTGNMTAMGWIKATYVDWRNLSAVISKGTDGGGWALQKAQRENGIGFYANVSGIPWYGVKSNVAVFDNTWHHVAGVYDGSKVYIYVDGGADVNSINCSGSIGTNDYPVWIGNNSQGVRSWEGLISDVRVYDIALSQSEINDIYTGGPTPPGQASNPNPADSATDVSIDADLSWTSGSGSTSSDVYFGTTSPGAFQGNQTATTFDPGTMSNDTTYYWRIDEINEAGTTTGNVWSFTTIVAAPGQASNPSPADSATDVDIDADLSWTAGSGSTSSDVYFGTTSPGTFQGNQTATTFEPGTMGYDTTYYWRIDQINVGGTTTGVVWSFTTEAAPPPLPGQAANPSPADSATNVAVSADLSWTAGSDATSHDVYFGTDSTPDSGEFQGNQTDVTFEPGTMDNDTTYYWRIDEVNAQGTTTGNVWSFTTIVAAPGQASSPSPSNSATEVSVDADLSWTAGSGATSHDVYFGTTSPGTFQGNQTATTFDPGTMSNDTTYYWRIDEVNAAGTTTGNLWSFTTESAAAFLPWTDGFESGDLLTGGWTTSGNASASNKAEYTGIYGAAIKGTAWMEKAISTAGFTAIHVKYARKTKGLDSGEYLY